MAPEPLSPTVPDVCTFADLLERVRDLPPLPVAVVGATDESVLAGITEAADAGIIEPTLIGPAASVAAQVDQVVGADRFPVVDVANEDAAAVTGVDLVTSGQVQGLVKGHIHTAAFLHPVVSRLRTTRRVTHCFVLELPTYPKLLTVTDAAINIRPDLTAKAAIVRNAVELVRWFGVDRPKVAALSAIETVNPDIPSTIDAACLAKMADRNQLHDCIVDGPLAFDAAISSESARIKEFASPVSGDVDILLAPDIDAGNILVKDLEYLAGATLAGIVLGTTAPVILTSRSDPPRSRLLSCALAAYVAHHEGAAAAD